MLDFAENCQYVLQDENHSHFIGITVSAQGRIQAQFDSG